jgi:hypothetical protein
MKQPTKPATFTTDKPILPGIIYLLQQGTLKKVVTKGSLERMNLTGYWEIKNEFKKDEKFD